MKEYSNAQRESNLCQTHFKPDEGYRRNQRAALRKLRKQHGLKMCAIIDTIYRWTSDYNPPRFVDAISMDQLVDETGMKDDAVRKWRNEAIKAGFIAVEGKTGQEALDHLKTIQGRHK